MTVPLTDGATSPLPAAATAAAAAGAATPAAPAAPATAASTTAAATPSDFVAELRLSALLVEDIEGRQADVGKLFLAEDRKDRIIAILVHGRAQLASR